MSNKVHTEQKLAPVIAVVELGAILLPRLVSLSKVIEALFLFSSLLFNLTILLK